MKIKLKLHHVMKTIILASFFIGHQLILSPINYSNSKHQIESKLVKANHDQEICILQSFLFSPCFPPLFTPIEPIFSMAAAKAWKNLFLSFAKA